MPALIARPGIPNRLATIDNVLGLIPNLKAFNNIGFLITLDAISYQELANARAIQ